MAFIKKNWEEVDCWIRAMGCMTGCDFDPFADEISSWQYSGKDLLSLSRDQFCEKLSHIPNDDAKSELWKAISKNGNKKQTTLGELDQNARIEKQPGAKPQSKEKGEIEPLRPPSNAFAELHNDCTHIEFRCNQSSEDVQPLRNYINALCYSYQNIGVMYARQTHSLWVIGPRMALKKPMERIQQHSKELFGFPVDIQETARLMANSFEIELETKELHNLHGLAENFKSINTSWGLLARNGAMSCVRIYGDKPIEALRMLSGATQSGLENCLTRHFLITSKAVLKQFIDEKSGVAPFLEDLEAGTGANVFHYESKGPSIIVVVFGKLKSVVDVGAKIKQKILQKIQPSMAIN